MEEGLFKSFLRQNLFYSIASRFDVFCLITARCRRCVRRADKLIRTKFGQAIGPPTKLVPYAAPQTYRLSE